MKHLQYEEPRAGHWISFDRYGLGSVLLLASGVFGACILGIATRPMGLLATFWPANALMVALLIRLPAARSVAGWAAAGCAFVGADLLTGASLGKALILNGANLASIGGVFVVLHRMPWAVLELKDNRSIAHLLLGSVAGSFAGGLWGAAANPMLFDGTAWSGFQFWFATELSNYLAVLPLMLSAPNPFRDDVSWSRPSLHMIAPVVALVASCVAGLVMGGPGAIVFVVPALLWCGLSYSVFVTALLTMVCGYWALSQLVGTYLPLSGQGTDSLAIVSYRLGVSLVLLSPLMQSVTSAIRRTAMKGLADAAYRDALTGVANRRAFAEQAPALIAHGKAPVIALLLDIDHFKSINDNFGHASGDAVLAELVRRVSHCLRDHDLFARLGGEEFAVVISKCEMHQGRVIADRIRRAICDEPVVVDGRQSLRVTVSIGLASAVAADGSVDRLLEIADSALYVAKRGGRNRVEVFGELSKA